MFMESLESEPRNEEKLLLNTSDFEKVTPPVSLSSDISDVQIIEPTSKEPGKMSSDQTAEKKPQKAPAKPRPPRRKPSDSPAKPRSRAKPSAMTPPMPVVVPSNPSPVYQTVFTTGQPMLNSIPVNFLQQAQVNVSQVQAASLNGLVSANSPRPLNRVLLPKPSSGQKQLLAMAQAVHNGPHNTAVNNLNGLSQNVQASNQQVVTVQQTNQADSKQGTALSVQSAQPAMTNGPQQTFVLNGPSSSSNHVMSLPKSQGLPSNTTPPSGTVQVRLQTIQTNNGPMTIAFFGDQPAFQLQQGQSINNQTTPNNQQTQQIHLSNFVRPPQQFQVQNSQQTQQGSFLANGFSQNVQGNVQFSGNNNRQSVQQIQQQTQPMQTSFLSSAPNVVSVSQVAQSAQQPSLGFSSQSHQQQQPQPEKPAEPEFNLEEFLTFPSTNTSSSSTSNTTSETNQFLNDLQSILDASSSPVKSEMNPLIGMGEPKSGEKRKRPKKDNTVVKKKVEEILKTYAEEKSRNLDTTNLLPSSESYGLTSSNTSSSITTGYQSGLPQTQLLPSTFQYQPSSQPKPELIPEIVSVASLAPTVPAIPPPSQSSAKRPSSATKESSKKAKKEVVVPVPVATPSLPKPTPLPPPLKPARKKTDLGEKLAKDVKTLEKLDMRTAFKGMINSANKLIPFHLLDDPEENPDIAEREETAFRHVAEGLLDRESQLYCRYMDQLVVEASDPVPKLDTLTCLSTWIDSEREEFEAEKAMATEGLDVRPPLWVYSDFKLESKVPFYNGRFLEGFPDEPSPLSIPEPLPVPPVETKPEPPKPTTSVLRPEAGRLKLVIKRASTVSPVPPENHPKKNLKLKLKMSANKWVVGGKSSESGPEDLMRSAVDSILQFGSDENGPLKKPLVAEGGVPRGKVEGRPAQFAMADQGGSSAQQPVINVNGGSLSTSSVFASEDSYSLYNNLNSISSFGSGSGAGSTSGNGMYENGEPDSALDEAVNSILG